MLRQYLVHDWEFCINVAFCCHILYIDCDNDKKYRLVISPNFGG